MLKQSLSHKLLQKLSPQQIQLMKLLQIPTATLDQRIKEELEANPALEEGDEQEEIYEFGAEEAKEGEESGDDFELDDYLTEYIEDDPISYKTNSNNYSDEEEEKSVPVTVSQTYHEYLEEQLNLRNIESEEEHLIALQLIGSIDEDGYLRRDLESIIDDLAFSQNIFTNMETLERLLQSIHSFDPPGSGARDLAECLLVQLKFKKKHKDYDEEELDAINHAIIIVEEHFEEFSKKHFQKLTHHIGIDKDELRDAMTQILKLNPRPATGFTMSGKHQPNYIIPDFILLNRDNELELSLNSKNAPDLRINDQYVEMLQTFNANRKEKKNTRKDKEAIMFIKQKIDSAKWFVDAIKQRQDTMYRTMFAIMQYQYEYLRTGDKMKMRPMILKDIADITGMDISTVSRVANSKFVQTEFGTIRLKDFFSESLQNANGDEVSTIEVKKILTEIIENENKRKPYSDEKLKKMLIEKGYQIARRTVAKYREQLNISVARLRKEL